MNNNNQGNNRRPGNGNPGNDGLNGWAVAAGVAGAAAVVGGGLWYIFGGDSKKESESRQPASPTGPENQPLWNFAPSPSTVDTARVNYSGNVNTGSFSFKGLSNVLYDMASLSSEGISHEGPLNDKPIINNLNALLEDCYKRYIVLNDCDLRQRYLVFSTIFMNIHETMKEVDPYYRRYSSTIQHAGSHYDKLRIKKNDDFPDEDVDIVIGLPVNFKQHPLNANESDIVLEPKSPGYIQLKMGAQFQNLLMRDVDDWQINRTAYQWMDERNYLLRSKFSFWFKSIVNKALNRFLLDIQGRRACYVDDVAYTIRTSESGPAITLIIENTSKGFRLDVDLVPALRFPESRWPVCTGYREIPSYCEKDYWMVVPKPNKAAQNEYDTDRSWRIALHNQERQLMHGTNHLRQAIRLIKKLRDVQGMDKIASYYIKTLFFLEVAERGDLSFWSKNNPATLFKLMVKKLHAAVVAGNIPYFWHKKNNLIGHVDRGTLNGYASKLDKLIKVLDSDTPGDYKLVAKFILRPAEFAEYNKYILN